MGFLECLLTILIGTVTLTKATFFCYSSLFTISHGLYLFFSFFFRLNIERVGDDMKKLVVSSESRKDFLTAHDLNRRATENEEPKSKLSDHYLLGSRRKVVSLNYLK